MSVGKIVSEITQHRHDFWRFFAERRPEFSGRLVRGNETSRWLVVGPRPLVVALYKGAGGVGIFVRGPSRERIGHARNYLFPYRHALAERLGRPGLKLGTAFLLHEGFRLLMHDRANWAQAADWLATRSPDYEAALIAVQCAPEPWPEDDWR